MFRPCKVIFRPSKDRSKILDLFSWRAWWWPCKVETCRPDKKHYLMFIGPCIILIVEELKTNMMSLAILFHFLCAKHVSGINISIIRSLRLFCWINTLVVLFLVRCVFEFRCGCIGVVSVLQVEVVLNMLRTLIYPSSGACDYSVELVVLFLVRCVLEIRCGWVGVVSVLQTTRDIKLFFYSSTIILHVI